MIHVAICDDEKDFVAYLNELLKQYAVETDEEIKVTAYYDGMELIEKYDTTIDLIFLEATPHNSSPKQTKQPSKGG